MTSPGNIASGVAPLTDNLGSGQSPLPAPENQKIRVAYITSPRELNSEGVGYDKNIPPTVRFLQEKIMAGDVRVSRIEIAAVVVDDNGKVVRGDDGKWHPLEGTSPAFSFLQGFCQQHGIAFHIEESAGWRSISGSRFPDEKHAAKVAYENKLLEFMRSNNIDVILSDSYVPIFNSTMLDPEKGFRGLIINIHPGIATEVPGVTPNFDALCRANYFTSDAAERQSLREAARNGAKTLSIRRNGYDESIKRIFEKMGIEYTMNDTHVNIPVVPGVFSPKTGATLHIVDEIVDHGPTINMSRGTPIRENDAVHDVRTRNYPTKNTIALNGLSMFVRRQETQHLIAENRIRNRAFNGDSLGDNGSLRQRAGQNKKIAGQSAITR